MTELATLTIGEALGMLATKELSPRDILESQRRVILRSNKKLHAFITLLPTGVKQTRRKGELHGITVAVKDNIYVKGHRTTAGSKVFRNFVPAFDADVVKLLSAAGATLVGKTNLHEFAFGATNINPHFGDCRNPWDDERISGGSSGGSAVAVASGMACAAVGTDTGGSVRTPAALCGVVGYKPTYGLTSRRGVVPLAWSLDTVGFLTRCVSDAARLALLSFESKSSPTLRRPKPMPLKRTRIGVPRNILEPLDSEVRSSFERSLELAEGEGARVVDVKFLHIEEIAASRSLITHAEAASYHREYFAAKFKDYGKDVRRRIAQGLAIPAVVYLDALRARSALLEYYRSIFRRVDVLALPTTRIPAPTVKASKSDRTAPGIRTALLGLTEPFNLFGAPSITIPCGLTRDGLPVGFQLAGDIYSDPAVLSFALTLERLFPNVSLNAR
ncbi:MAG: amidase [Nitrososphaerales archaeon]|nr:amidase [Nitrososphaerales archaeon]